MALKVKKMARPRKKRKYVRKQKTIEPVKKENILGKGFSLTLGLWGLLMATSLMAGWAKWIQFVMALVAILCAFGYLIGSD